MRETLGERKSRTKISRMNWPLHAALRPLRSAIPFLSLALFARVFLFSLTPVYFFLLSSARAYVTAGRFIETLVTRFQVPRLARNLPRLSNPIYSLFSIAPFFLSPSPYPWREIGVLSTFIISLSLSRGAASSFISQEIDSFLPLGRVAHAFSFPALSPSPSEKFLSSLCSSLFSHSQSSALPGALVVPFLPLRSFNFLPSSGDVFSPPRGGGNARENHSSRIALRKMFAFFPNHNLSDVLFATDVSIMDI